MNLWRINVATTAAWHFYVHSLAEGLARTLSCSCRSKLFITWRPSNSLLLCVRNETYASQGANVCNTAEPLLRSAHLSYVSAPSSEVRGKQFVRAFVRSLSLLPPLSSRAPSSFLYPPSLLYPRSSIFPPPSSLISPFFPLSVPPRSQANKKLRDVYTCFSCTSLRGAAPRGAEGLKGAALQVAEGLGSAASRRARNLGSRQAPHKHSFICFDVLVCPTSPEKMAARTLLSYLSQRANTMLVVML